MAQRVNYVGIVAAIIGFISLFLPWWTMTLSGFFMYSDLSGDLSVYTYDALITMEAMGYKETESVVDDFSLWYGYVALALVVGAGAAGIVGSAIVGKTGKLILTVAGIIMLLSVTIFVGGLASELTSPKETVGEPELTNISYSGSFGLFSSGSFSADVPEMGKMAFSYTTYLSWGFLLAIAATALTFVSLLGHPIVAPPPPPVPPERPQAPLPSPAPPTTTPTTLTKIHCIYCGAENPPHASFCLKCGKKMVKP